MMKQIVLLITLCPFYAYGKCEVLSGDTLIVDSVSNDQLGLMYEKVIDEYIDKYRNNYRPEAFFAKLNQGIDKIDSLPAGLEQRNKKARALKTLSDFSHYDESIKLELMALARQKYTASFYCLGFLHEKGIGTIVNNVEAWAWFMTAFAVDGSYAKEHLTRVWEHLNAQQEVQAKRLADRYIRLYTE